VDLMPYSQLSRIPPLASHYEGTGPVGITRPNGREEIPVLGV
jgi:hypothetical protein